MNMSEKSVKNHISSLWVKEHQNRWVLQFFDNFKFSSQN